MVNWLHVSLLAMGCENHLAREEEELHSPQRSDVKKNLSPPEGWKLRKGLRTVPPSFGRSKRGNPNSMASPTCPVSKVHVHVA